MSKLKTQQALATRSVTSNPQDNKKSYESERITEFEWEVLRYLTYSQDLTSFSFNLIFSLKDYLDNEEEEGSVNGFLSHEVLRGRLWKVSHRVERCFNQAYVTHKDKYNIKNWFVFHKSSRVYLIFWMRDNNL